MKILMINDSLKEVGGAERYFYNLIKLLRSRGHHVSTITFDSFDNLDGEDYVLKQYAGKIGQFFAHRFISLRYFKIRKIIKRIKPDVIHLHNIYENRYSILLACYGYKTIQTAHDLNVIFPGYLKKYYLNKKNITSLYLKTIIIWHRLIKNLFISQFLTPSDFLKKEMIKYGYKNIVHLPYFINPETHEIKKNNIDPIILYSGRLTKEKGVDYLVEVFKLLLVDKNIKIIVAGDGPDKHLIEKLAKNNNQIKITGWLPYDELKKIYASADVLVVTSMVPESFCLVILEALIHLLPVVAFDIGGSNELVTSGYNGFLIEVGNVKEMTEKINILIKNRDLSQKISANIKNSLISINNAPYGSDFHYQQIINIYQK